MSYYKRKLKTGTFWYVRYAVAPGVYKWKSVGKVGEVPKPVVVALDEEMRRNYRLGKLGFVGMKIPTLNEFKDEFMDYQKTMVRKHTLLTYKIILNHMIPFLGDMKLTAITTADLQVYILHRLKSGIKPATINRELAMLSVLFNFAKLRNKFIGDNPVSKIKRLHADRLPKRILSRDEEKRLLENSYPHMKPVIQTALLTGMRKSEILTLKWNQVDFEAGFIVLEGIGTKSKKSREVPINRELKEILLEQKLHSGHQGYVFLTFYGEPYATTDGRIVNALNRPWMYLCKRAKVANLRFHDLRHTAITRMLEKGATIPAVAKMVGHEKWETTMIYTHPEESIREAAELLCREPEPKKKQPRNKSNRNRIVARETNN